MLDQTLVSVNHARIYKKCREGRWRLVKTVLYCPQGSMPRQAMLPPGMLYKTSHQIILEQRAVHDDFL